MATQHGGSILGETLYRLGVRHLFTLCGGHISPILTGAQDAGVQVVDVRDEASAVFAADAAARMTGIPGVAAVTAGPGVTNTMTAVKNAQMAESPVIIFGGATATILKGRGSLQDIDQMALMAPVTKWCTSVKTVSGLAPTLEHAFHVATSGVPGPVFIEVPVDMLYPEEVVRGWYMSESGVDKMKGAAGKALKLALEANLARIFRAPHLPTELLPLRSDLDRLAAPLHLARTIQVARQLEQAKRPVLIVGSQSLVNMSPSEANKLAAAINKLGIPTFLGGTARGLLGRHSDIQFRHKRGNALKEADLVIVAGFPFDFRLGYGRKFNSKATIVSANLDNDALHKNKRPDIGIHMHPGEFLRDLAHHARPPKTSLTPWFEKVREREDARDAEIAQMADPAPEGVNPMSFFLKMEEAMSDDAILVVDGGDFVATAAYILRPRAPLSWLDPGVFGTLGVGGGFALGATATRPTTQTWIIWGDGSSAYSLAEYDSFLRHGLAPIAVIGTDASWGQIARDQVEILGTTLGCDLRHTDYHIVAQGYGGEGILVTREEDVDDALKRAVELSAQGTPVVINLHLAPSDFRKGSLSM